MPASTGCAGQESVNFDDLPAPPVAGVDLEGVTAYAITAGAAHTCALRSNGTARCWGTGADGRLGRGSTATTATATGNADIQIFALLTVGGTVSGLAGSGLVLRNNGGDDLPMQADGAFAFPTALLEGAAYTVTVRTQPMNPSQTCAVANDSGTLGRTNVANVAITCVTNRYAIGGTVYGLAGSGLVLRNNGGDDLVVNAEGAFGFATSLESGTTYDVTIQTQPSNPRQTCVLMGGSGTVVNGDVTSIAINCATDRFMIGGIVTGLAGTGLVLRNGSDSLAITANGTFAFAVPLADLSPYAVTAQTQPASQICTVANGSGAVAGANVTNVAVSCVTMHTIGGTVTGLGNGQSVVLQDNGGDNLTVGANGGFAFSTQLAVGSPYAVTVLAAPANSTCTVTNGSGTIGVSNVTNVSVTCINTSCTLPWGVSINDGQSVTAFKSSSSGCGGSCISEIRTCSMGVLSGSFTNQSCSNPSQGPTSCGTNCVLYSCPGSYSFAVPSGISTVTATLVGGGGGGGGGGPHTACTCSSSSCSYTAGSGGGGGSITATVLTPPGEVLTITVGAPGAPGVGSNSSSGGRGSGSSIGSTHGSAASFGGVGGSGAATNSGGVITGGSVAVVGGSSTGIGVRTIVAPPATPGGDGAQTPGLCDGSRFFFLDGGAGGQAGNSNLSGFGGGGNGGSADQSGGHDGAAGQSGAVQISW